MKLLILMSKQSLGVLPENQGVGGIIKAPRGSRFHQGGFLLQPFLQIAFFQIPWKFSFPARVRSKRAIPRLTRFHTGLDRIAE